MCFLPNSRASMDQAPGPIIAKVAPRAASTMGINGSPGRENAIHISTMVTVAPASGVHKTGEKKYPRPYPDDLGGGLVQTEAFPHVGDPTMNQKSAS